MRRRQQLDVLRIDRLATKCCGEILAAAVLAAAPDGVSTIEQAATYAENNEVISIELVKKDLFFGWIYEDLISIKHSLSQINFEEIEQFDRAKQDTFRVLDIHLIAICERIENNTSGIKACIKKIFANLTKRPKISHIALQLLVSVREHLESSESFVIQGWRSDSKGRPCGRRRTAVVTTEAGYAIQAI
ncbi:hypothetical protein [Bradyrhizobium sp. 191]|uniref:hypothetical protein n=1 Tax=Bradyrhizobium sp. 191 TaxID=2782659 RepID=UPI001FFEA341|nr:hypothetical protein [Bradyrhizobium sp. 191]UPJ64285.1 hypothetical protein IVB23_30595 [Bradyrhizobium sp. 191]